MIIIIIIIIVIIIMKQNEASWIMNLHESSRIIIIVINIAGSLCLNTYQINLTFSSYQWHVEFISTVWGRDSEHSATLKKQRSWTVLLKKWSKSKYPFPSQTEGFKKVFLTENAVFLVTLLVPQMETNPPHHASPKDESWRTPDTD